ncbi:Calcium/calmodulin dependent protein kinase II association-domain protein [Burkholderia sp. 8Y]|uniref:SgcJ/EcaC family oxidoreductase n=1 Tax=Burkholderia sp. 8Y TaxID=2653133 RepID=UPI0012F04F7A|nr:Calcium/calmodulin dependent protein kinase II association-domain protein [Burkholderia sp. 8Y]
MLAGASSATLAKTETCKSTSDKEIAALFDRWNDSLKTGNPQKVVANYAPRSILLPTVSNKPRLSVEDKLDYFKHFLESKPVGTIDFRDIMIECNTAIDAGVYTFRFKDGSAVKARYTFTYVWNGHRWLITSHHSSKMPESE